MEGCACFRKHAESEIRGCRVNRHPYRDQRRDSSRRSDWRIPAEALIAGQERWETLGDRNFLSRVSDQKCHQDDELLDGNDMTFLPYEKNFGKLRYVGDFFRVVRCDARICSNGRQHEADTADKSGFSLARSVY